MRAWLVVLAACTAEPEPPAASSAAPPAAPEPLALPDRPLRLGRPPNLGKDTRGEYEPLAGYLAEALGHPVQVVVPASYEQVVDELAAGRIDIGLLTPFVYVKAKERVPELRLLVS